PAPTLASDCKATTGLARDATCQLRVAFAPTPKAAVFALVLCSRHGPTTNAAVAASVVVSSNGPTLTVPVTGKGAAPFASVSPTSINFGKVNLNTNSATQTVTLSNTGDGALTITSIALTAGSGFTRTGGTCGTTMPATLAAGATCTINLRFSPGATLGVRNDTLTITDTSNNV